MYTHRVWVNNDHVQAGNWITTIDVFDHVCEACGNAGEHRRTVVRYLDNRRHVRRVRHLRVLAVEHGVRL